MSEAFIRVHKPEQVNKKDIEVKNASNPEALRVFNDFVLNVENIKKKIHMNLISRISLNTIEYFQHYAKKRIELEEYEKLLNEKNGCGSSTVLKLNPMFTIIPTITLLTGINSQDYTNLYDSLITTLRHELTRYVFVFTEKNAQNLKTIQHSIHSQLESFRESNEKQIKKSLFSIGQLFELIQYENSKEPVPSTSKQMAKSVIFIFKQFELIPKETIENFISLLSCHLEKLPVFFIFESASQSNVVYEQLNCHAISKLCIKKLHLMSPEQYMDTFLNELFIRPIGPSSTNECSSLLSFKVSGDILKYLYEFFNEYNFSLSSFIHAIKFCFYEHLTNSQDNHVYFDDKCQPNENVQAIREKWTRDTYEFTFTCRLLHEIVKSFPIENDDSASLFNPHCRKFSGLYVRMWYECTSSQVHRRQQQQQPTKFVDTKPYLYMRQLVKLASNTTFYHIVVALMDLTRVALVHADNKMNECHMQMLEQLGQFDALLAQFKQVHDEGATSQILSSLKEHVLEFLHARYFTRYFSTDFFYGSNKASSDDLPAKLPIATHFVYDEFDTFKRRLYDSHRLNIHGCLSNTFDYVKSQIGSMDSTTQLNFDAYETPKKRAKATTNHELISWKNENSIMLSIVYKIYLECGHMINLYDWLQAFVEHLDNADISELSETKRSILQALFFRSITELQFMGFIKPTSRKVDHVVKLINNSNLVIV